MLTRQRLATLALVIPIVELALTTGYIHLTLGGPLFTLNALGYGVLAAAYAVGSSASGGFIGRLAWAPRLALLGYTLTTIAAYLVIGPYFTLGWVAKAVEVALVTLIVADLARAYSSPSALLDAVIGRRRSAGST